MWKLRRKKSAPGADERAFPAEKEFWLVRGAFREGRLSEAGKGATAFAIARQRRSVRRENGPVRIGFTGSSMD